MDKPKSVESIHPLPKAISQGKDGLQAQLGSKTIENAVSKAAGQGSSP